MRFVNGFVRNSNNNNALRSVFSKYDAKWHRYFLYLVCFLLEAAIALRCFPQLHRRLMENGDSSSVPINHLADEQKTDVTQEERATLEAELAQVRR